MRRFFLWLALCASAGATPFTANLQTLLGVPTNKAWLALNLQGCGQYIVTANGSVVIPRPILLYPNAQGQIGVSPVVNVTDETTYTCGGAVGTAYYRIDVFYTNSGGQTVRAFFATYDIAGSGTFNLNTATPKNSFVGGIGPQGPPGPAGSTWYTGGGTPAVGLGINGDLYLDQLTADVYKKLSGTWTLNLNIKGQNGANGTNGATGPQGPSGGTTNWRGAWSSGASYVASTFDSVSDLGSSYVALVNNTNSRPPNSNWQILAQAGATGANGTNGTNGTNGANGLNGAAWFNQAGVPSNGTGANGDYDINTSNSDVYQKLSGAWALVGNIKGATGSAGTNGTNGLNGATWLINSGVPGSGLGNDNDLYLNTSNGDEYQKQTSVWVLVGNNRGPAGPGTVNGPSTTSVGAFAAFNNTVGTLLKQSSNLSETGGAVTDSGDFNVGGNLTISGLLNTSGPFTLDTTWPGSNIAVSASSHTRLGVCADGQLCSSQNAGAVQKYLRSVSGSFADATPTDYVVGAGTAQAQTAALSPAATALTAGLEVKWKPSNANTGAAPTLAVNGLTATAITKCGTTALIANDLSTSRIAIAVYDGTQFQLINPNAAICADTNGNSATTTAFQTTPNVCGTGFVSTGIDINGNAICGTAGTSGANVNLSNISSTSINADLLPNLDATRHFGSLAKRWLDGFFSNGIGTGTATPPSFSGFTFVPGSAPATPASGILNIYALSGGRFNDKDSSGAIGTTVVARNAAAHNFFCTLAASTGVIGDCQPAIADLSDGSTIVRTTDTVNTLDSRAFCIDVGSTDDYVCTLSPTVVSLANGTQVHFKANTSNTGAATLNACCNAFPIKKLQGAITTVLADNDIRAGQWVDVIWDATNSNFQMESQLGNAATDPNAVTASSAATAAKQLCTASGATKTCTYITFPALSYSPAANCVNSVAGSAWSTGATPAALCRAGTNNKTGLLSPWGASDVGYIQFHIAADADLTTQLPSLMLEVTSTASVNANTIIMQESVACSKEDGSTTDDVAFNAARSFATVTLNANANRVWNTTLTLNSTDLTGCVAPGVLWVKISRTTDTATNVGVYGLSLTQYRLLTVQAN